MLAYNTPINIMTPVLCTGHYNIMHAGHIQLFEYARSLGDYLIVGLNGDNRNIMKYGAKAISLEQRIIVVSSCRYVDEVISFNEDNPSELIRKLRPKVFVRGPDYAGITLPEQAALDEVGCKLVIQPTIKIASSTRILEESSAIYLGDD